MRDGITSEEIHEVVERELTLAGAPGASVAVMIGGAPVTSVGVGPCGAPATTPVGADDRYLLYSITKVLIAVAVVRLVEMGSIGLDQGVGKVLPDVGLGAGVTVRRLLNHTAGIGDYGGLAEYAADLKRNPDIPWTEEQFLERVLSRGSLFEPGNGWAYSNVGYLLLRLLIQRVADASFRDVLDELVVGPLGLRSTSVVECLEDTRSLAPGYSTQLSACGELQDISHRYHPGWVSHGVVLSTAAETARILDALFAGGLVGPASLDAMLQAVEVPVTHPRMAMPGYGLGLMVDRDMSRWRVAGHAGGGPGYATAAFHFGLADGAWLTSVALANRDGHDVAERIVFALAERWSARG
jgi:D-alanyl-D-alanine carboxypeptidase